MSRVLVVGSESVRGIVMACLPKGCEGTPVSHQCALEMVDGEPFDAIFLSANIPTKEIIEDAQFTLGDVAEAINQRNPDRWFIIHAFTPLHPATSPITGFNCVFSDGNLTKESLARLVDAATQFGPAA